MEKNCFRLNDLKVSPKEVVVRSFCNLSISFLLDFNLPKDSFLVFRYRGGRNNKNDWYYLQTHDPNKYGYTKLNIINSNSIKIIPILNTGKELSIKYLICKQKGIKKGIKFQFNVYNTLVQSLVETSKKIEVFIEFPNQKPILLENGPTFNVINDKFDHITIICPSLVAIDEEFEILLRIEDQFKNLVKEFSDTIQLFELRDYEKKIHIVDVELNEENKGILRKEGLKFSTSGIYFIEGFYDNLYFKSNPIICREKPIRRNLYWGFIHGHTLKSDGMRELNEYFENMLNAGLDFGTCTEHDHLWETSEKDFKEIKKMVKEYHKNGKFVSIFGYEYGTWYSGQGDICIYYYDDNLPIFSSDINKYNSIKKLIKNLKCYKDNILLIGHHTALRPGFRNWDYFNNSIEKLVEIYSTWGNQEYPSDQGNPLPPRYKFFGYGKYARKRGAILERKNSFVSVALGKGFKLGFTAGGDDHFGMYPSGSIDPDNGIYPPGIMAIWAEKLTKESIWRALNSRRCYGTTGPRVIIEFFIDGCFMGDIIELKEYPQLKFKRNIQFNITSPINIERIEIIRNNIVFKKISLNLYSCNLKLIDTNNFDEIALNHIIEKEKFVFYYLRLFLSDNNLAWASPIWIIDAIKDS